MTCGPFRSALSARLDGEELGIGESLLDAHLATCVDCRGWQVNAESVHRSMRVHAAEVVPDLTPSILAAIGRSARDHEGVAPGLRGCRLALAGLAILQLAMAVQVIVAAQIGAMHADHELGAWGIALAAAFAVAAWRPRAAIGMVPFLAVLVATLMVTSVIDITSGNATASTETAHAMAGAGLIFVLVLKRLQSEPTTRALAA